MWRVKRGPGHQLSPTRLPSPGNSSPYQQPANIPLLSFHFSAGGRRHFRRQRIRCPPRRRCPAPTDPLLPRSPFPFSRHKEEVPRYPTTAFGVCSSIRINWGFPMVLWTPESYNAQYIHSITLLILAFS